MKQLIYIPTGECVLFCNEKNYRKHGTRKLEWTIEEYCNYFGYNILDVINNLVNYYYLPIIYNAVGIMERITLHQAYFEMIEI